MTRIGLALLLAGMVATGPQQDAAAPPGAAGHARMVALLAEIGRSEPLGFQAQARAERMRRDLEAARLAPGALVEALAGLGLAEMQVDVRRGIARLEQAAESLAGLSAADRGRLQPTIDLWIAVGYLRQAMTANCVDLRRDAACVPHSGAAGVHPDPGAARAAIPHLEAIMRDAEPGNALYDAVRWLATIAYMDAGLYPDDVAEGLAAPPQTFAAAAAFPRFENVAAAAGLDAFSYAGGVVVDDFDGDGWLDVMASTMDPNGQLRFFRNRGDGSFAEVTAAANLTGIVGGLNLNQTDYDNDGDLDLLVLRGGWLGADGRHPNSLLRNNGDATFTDVTFDAGLGAAHHPTQTAAWADYDNDGDLDLYVGNEWTMEQQSPSQLFRNNGDGTFDDVARAAFVRNLSRAKGTAWGDYDGDRFPDLYVSNLGGDNRLYHNLGDGTFRDVALDLGVTGPRQGFSIWFWDVDNDGVLDLLVNNHGVPEAAAGLPLAAAASAIMGNPDAADIPALYRGDGHGGFTDVAADYGIEQSTLVMGSNFGDLDNDGYLDFLLGTGYPGYEALLPNVMYRNRGGTSFEDVTWAGGFGHLAKGHGIAFADIDNDGDQDVVVQLGGMWLADAYFNALYENPGFGAHWISVKLVGTTSNRAAIGARIRLEIDDAGERRTIYRTIGSGSSFGGNPLRAEIGIGAARTVDVLEVYWPTSATTQTFHDVAADRFIRIVEGDDRIREPAAGSLR